MTRFNPNFVTPPGESLLDILEERGIAPDDFAVQLGVNRDFLARLFEGKEAITAEMAEKLERLLDTPTHFWLKREQRYQEFLQQRV